MSYLHHNNTLCVTAAAILAVVPQGTYKVYTQRKDISGKAKINVVRRGCNGKPALVEFSTLPQDIKLKVVEKLGAQPEVAAEVNGFKKHAGIDAQAVSFFSHYTLEDGRLLPQDTQREYITNANLLNAIAIEFKNLVDARRKNGKSTNGYWAKRAQALQELKKEADFAAHTLPKNGRRLQDAYKAYIQPVKRIDDTNNEITTPNYESLISGKWCNTNTLKVSNATAAVLLALYTQNNRPFAKEVHNQYTLFVKGKRDIIDVATGEVYNREDFKEISLGTVKNWLKHGLNDAVADSKRMGAHNFNNEQRPFMRRKSPLYAFSKLSMDDRDLPRKLTDGNRVKAYYAYDVASGCVVGYAHSVKKTEALFIDCLRNTFQTIYANNWKCPAEVEVENHLVNKFTEQLEAMFTFLTICAPGNSQAKRAEHLNRAKKYSAEKQLHGAIGRWWAKGKAYRVDNDFVNDEFVGHGYSYKQLVADDIEAINLYNNSLHPKQDVYPGLTRWQVLQQCQNPNLHKVNRALVAKCIGERVNTTLRRNQAIQVQYRQYALPNLDCLNLLQPGRKDVQAYYLPTVSGDIPEVYVYQGETPIGRFEAIERYQEAKIERTATDRAIMQKQFAQVARFDGAIKAQKGQLSKVVVVDTVESQQWSADSEDKPVQVVQHAPEPEEFDESYYTFDEEAIKRLSRKG